VFHYFRILSHTASVSSPAYSFHCVELPSGLLINMHERCDTQIKGPNCTVSIGILVKYATPCNKVQCKFRFKS
jgi:hypothetical protein